MIDLPAGLGQPELREIYSATSPAPAGYFGGPPADPEEWEQWRKYAYVKYWESRLNEESALSEQEMDEWERYIALDFLNNVACSVVGEAARRSLLPESALRRFAEMPSMTAHASRQLRARLALSGGGSMKELVEELLTLKASWALYEVLGRDLSEGDVALLGAAAQDNRLSRSDRHHLREAVRRRDKRSLG